MNEKKSPLFDLINAIFVDKNYINSITKETANQNIFMVLRRLAIKYPIECNVFNDYRVNPIDVIKFLSDFMYCGVIPKWVYTSVKSVKKKDKAAITSADIKLYKKHYDVNDKDFDDAMLFFGDELTNEVKEIRDFYNKINEQK